MCAATEANAESPSTGEQSQRESPEGPNTLLILDRNSKTIQRFKPENDEWHTSENGITEEMGCWNFSAAVLRTALLIFMNNKAVYRFQRTSKVVKWHRLPDMKFNHGQRPPVVVFNDTFYVIGSGGVGVPVDFAERYSVSRKGWMPIKNMLSPRRNSALVSTRDSIYNIGGLGKSGVLSSVEQFCVSSKAWSEVTTLEQPRHSAAAVASGNDIFIMGGFVNKERRNDVFCMSMPSALCISMKPMQIRRSVFTACIIDGKIFAVGGDNRRNDSVEVYDAEKDEWKFMDIFSTLEIDAAVAMTL